MPASPSFDSEPSAAAPASIPALLQALARRMPGSVVLIDAVSGEHVTARQLEARVERATRGLAALGFGAGDCLCTLMGNDVAWYVAALAAQQLGGSISGINPLATPGEIVRQFNLVKAKAILAAPPLMNAARAAAEAMAIPTVISTGPAGAAGVVALADLDGPAAGDAAPVVGPDSVALLPFSSGTTGLPKAAIITHANMAAAGRQIVEAIGIGEGDRLLGLAPLFHIVGPNVFVAAMMAGAAVVVVPRFEPELVLAATANHGVTHMPLLTPLLRPLARHPAGQGCDFSRLRVIAAGGSALSGADRDEAARRFGAAICQVYGMTETAAIVAVESPRSRDGAMSCGRPVAGLSVRTANPETGVVQPAGAEGEIQLRGPNVFAGYLGNAEATGQMFTPDGWMRTGDLGHVDGQGRVVITGRIKELIKVNAGQVPPAELEMLLGTCDGVIECAVVGRPNRYQGEIPVAYLVLGDTANPYLITDAVNEQVLPYKRIRAIEIIDSLPRNATGKVDRRALAVIDSERRRGRSGQSAALP